MNYLNQKYSDHWWSTKFQQVLYQAISLKKQEEFDSEKYNRKRIAIIREFENLLEQPPDKKDKELKERISTQIQVLKKNNGVSQIVIV